MFQWLERAFNSASTALLTPEGTQPKGFIHALGSNIAPAWIEERPEVVLALSSRNRNLLLAVLNTDPIPYAVIGFLLERAGGDTELTLAQEAPLGAPLADPRVIEAPRGLPSTTAYPAEAYTWASSK